MAEIELKDMYWASVSGGKDSLYMFRLILEHPDKYTEMLEYIKDFENKKGVLIYHAPIEEINKRIDKKWINKVL